MHHPVAAEEEPFSIQCLVSLSASEYVELHIANSDATDNLTVTQMQMTLLGFVV